MKAGFLILDKLKGYRETVAFTSDLQNGFIDYPSHKIQAS